MPKELTVALNVLLLVHVPPNGVPVRGNVLPIHAVLPPDMDGAAFTVTILTLKQPPSMSVILVTPADTPVTMPEPSTVAMEGLPLLHEAPVTEPERLIADPAQTVLLPVMIGAEVTVVVYTA